MNIAQAIVRELQAQLGNLFMCGVSGANIEDLFEAAISLGLTPLLAKHEFGAACMADGFARITDTPAVVLTTSGAGALNVLPGLAESLASRVPLLALIGQPPLVSKGRGAFQETSGYAATFDIEQVLKPATKYIRRIGGPDEVLPALREALHFALREPKGPSVLLLPKDVQKAECAGFEPRAASPPPLSRPPVDVRPRGSKPVFIFGEAVVRCADRSKILAWAERLEAPFCLTLQAKQLAPPSHPLFCGLTGVMGHAAIRETLNAADEIFLIGTRLPELDRYGIEALLLDKALRHYHVEPSAISGARWEYTAIEMESLASQLPAAPQRPAPVAQLRPEAPRSEDPLRLEHLAQAMTPFASRRPRNWVLDAGNAVATIARDLPLCEGSQFIIALGMGGMGYSFGAGIGAGSASPLPTVVFAGDGSFFMHGGEIHTAVERNLPILYVLADNSGHAMCSLREDLFFSRKSSPLNRFRRSELGLGLKALYPTLDVARARTPAELTRELERLEAVKGPAALVLELDADDVPPFQPFVDILQRRLQK